MFAGAPGSLNSGPERLVDSPSDIAGVVRAHRLGFLRPVRQPLLLISEIQRSGGTMFSQLLDGHPQVHAHPNELKIGRPDKYHWPDLDMALPPAQWFDLLKEDSVLHDIQFGYRKASKRVSGNRRPLPFIFSQDLQREIFIAVCSERRPDSQRQVLDAYATSYFNAWIDLQGIYRNPESVKFWSAFTPRVAMKPENCRRFFRDYPDGYLISVIRNPLSWFASASRHDAREYGDRQKAVALWLASARSCIENFRAYPGRVVLVGFEQLVADTASVMKRFCATTGLDFDDVLLTTTFNGLPMQANSSFAPAAAGSILESSADRGKHLTPEDARYIGETAAGCYHEAMELCGLSSSIR